MLDILFLTQDISSMASVFREHWGEVFYNWFPAQTVWLSPSQQNVGKCVQFVHLQKQVLA